jgi:hypothetical protein
MELDEFVRKTIEQLITGVKSTHDVAKANGVQVGSSSMTGIEFDVALTTTEGTGSQVGGGIRVGGFGLGAEGKSEHSNSSVSRIKFTVMITLPSTH